VDEYSISGIQHKDINHIPIGVESVSSEFIKGELVVREYQVAALCGQAGADGNASS
jgi:hypothetical protein